MISEASDSRNEFGLVLEKPANLRLIFGLAASLVALAALVWTVDVSQIKGALAVSRSDTFVVGLAALAYTAAFWLRAFVWRLLLTPHPRPNHRQSGNLAGGQTTPPPAIGVSELFSILQTSLFLNHLLPIKAGEIARPYLATQHGVRAAEAISTTLVGRLADFAALACLASLALPAIGEKTELLVGLQLMVGLIVVAQTLLFLHCVPLVIEVLLRHLQ